MPHEFTPSHPYAEIFPLHVEGQTFFDFSDDLKENGLRTKIVKYQEMILDGRRRERGCRRAGIIPRYTEFKGDDAEALAFVVSHNLHRRHLGEGEKAIIAGRIATAKDGRPKTVATCDGKEKPVTSAQAAEMTGTSEASVDRAKKIIASGTTELQEAVIDGTLSVSDAANVAGEPPKVQNKAVKDVKKGKAKSATNAVKTMLDPEPANHADDEPWVDAWGIPITKEATAAFTNAEKFDELIKVLRSAKKLFKELADIPGGQLLQQAFVSANTRTGFQHNGLETCIMNVADCKPKYTVCPYAYCEHQEHDKTCTLCRGLGWIGAVSKSSGPPESLINAAKKAHGVS